MSITSVKAATQDTVNGIAVATILNRDNNAVALQAMALVGVKEDESKYYRSAITAADTETDLSATGLGAVTGDVGNALNAAIYATCSVTGATLEGVLVLYDSLGSVLALSSQITFASDATRKITASGNYVCPLAVQSVACACKIAFYVNSVSAGTWTVTVRPF